jgi:hypothetical protein
MSSPLGSPGAGRLGGGTISFEAVRGKSAPGDGDRDGRGRGVRDGAATRCGRTTDCGEPGAGCAGGDSGEPGAGGDTGETRDGGDGAVTATRGGGFGFTLGRGLVVSVQ